MYFKTAQSSIDEGRQRNKKFNLYIQSPFSVLYFYSFLFVPMKFSGCTIQVLLHTSYNFSTAHIYIYIYVCVYVKIYVDVYFLSTYVCVHRNEEGNLCLCRRKCGNVQAVIHGTHFCPCRRRLRERLLCSALRVTRQIFQCR